MNQTVHDAVDRRVFEAVNDAIYCFVAYFDVEEVVDRAVHDAVDNIVCWSARGRR